MNYKDWDKGSSNYDLILNALHKKPMTATELKDILNIERASTYYYLTKLHIEGKINKKRFGKTVYYGIKKDNR